MTWLSTAIDVGRRVGHAIFYVVMVLAFVVAVGLGVAGAQDAADGQPVVWGTFTEEECQPSMTGCRSIGRWLSDDRTILKEGIYLDGHTGRGGTARANYQPSGLTSDGADNIVHIHAATSAGLWFPWVLPAFSAGAVVYYTRKWRREDGRPNLRQSESRGMSLGLVWCSETPIWSAVRSSSASTSTRKRAVVGR